jgi:hypothetical protein
MFSANVDELTNRSQPGCATVNVSRQGVCSVTKWPHIQYVWRWPQPKILNTGRLFCNELAVGTCSCGPVSATLAVPAEKFYTYSDQTWKFGDCLLVGRFLYVGPIENCNIPNLARICSPSVCHSSSYSYVNLPSDCCNSPSPIKPVCVPNVLVSATRDVHFSPLKEVQIFMLSITQFS